MMLLIHSSQAIKRKVRIHLRGRDVSVAKNRLHGTQIGTILDHVRGGRVPQHMRRSVTSSRSRRLANHLPDALPRQLFASTANKE